MISSRSARSQRPRWAHNPILRVCLRKAMDSERRRPRKASADAPQPRSCVVFNDNLGASRTRAAGKRSRWRLFVRNVITSFAMEPIISLSPGGWSALVDPGSGTGEDSVYDKRKSYNGNPETPSPSPRKLVRRARRSLIPFELPDSMKVIKDFLTTRDEAYMNKAFLGLSRLKT